MVIRAIPSSWTIQMCHFGAFHVIYMEIFFKNCNCVLESICGELILVMNFHGNIKIEGHIRIKNKGEKGEDHVLVTIS